MSRLPDEHATLNDNLEPARPDHQCRRQWLEALAILMISRFGVWMIAYLGLAMMYGPPKPGNAIPGNHFFDGWTRWDAQWYAHIATHGYTGKPIDDSNQTDAGHFPLYPWATRAFNWIIGDVYISGILVSNLSFILAGLLLWRIIADQFGAVIARRSIILWCAWPFSYAFSAMYTESLFVLCVAGAFFAGERRIWPAAAACAALAGFTRLVGSATAVAIAVMYLHRAAGWRLQNVRRDALWLALGLGGIVAFAIMLWAWFGDPLLFVKVHHVPGWGDFNSFAEFKDVLRQWRDVQFGKMASGNVPLLHTLHVISMLIAAVLSIIALRKLPPAWSVWLILTVIISYYRWACFGRHFSTCWPAFVVAAMLLNNRAFAVVVYVMTLLLALLTLMFTQGYWVA